MDNIESVFKNIKTDARNIDNLYSNINDDATNLEFKFGTSIWEFFEVLHRLFNQLDLLTDEEKHDTSKFKFIASYPDEIYENTNIVTYDVIRRVPLQVDSKIIQSSSTKYLKPRFVKEKYNTITGNVEELYAIVFNNTISLNVFSNKSRTLNNITRIIESLFYRYSSYIKRHVDEFIFIGMNSVQFSDRYDEKDRIFSRELQFSIITSEFFILELEQLKSIDLKDKMK